MGDGGAKGCWDRYLKPSLPGALWTKGNRTVVVWVSQRGDREGLPFDMVEAMRTVTGGFISKLEGAPSGERD